MVLKDILKIFQGESANFIDLSVKYYELFTGYIGQFLICINNQCGCCTQFFILQLRPYRLSL